MAKSCAVLAKGFAASPGCPGGLEDVRRGEDRLGMTTAKGERGHEVFQEETWCCQ